MEIIFKRNFFHKEIRIFVNVLIQDIKHKIKQSLPDSINFYSISAQDAFEFPVIFFSNYNRALTLLRVFLIVLLRLPFKLNRFDSIFTVKEGDNGSKCCILSEIML